MQQWYHRLIAIQGHCCNNGIQPLLQQCGFVVVAIKWSNNMIKDVRERQADIDGPIRCFLFKKSVEIS
jgi:hypothetical protein